MSERVASEDRNEHGVLNDPTYDCLCPDFYQAKDSHKIPPNHNNLNIDEKQLSYE